jgi:hypothetical protein
LRGDAAGVVLCGCFVRVFKLLRRDVVGVLLHRAGVEFNNYLQRRLIFLKGAHLRRPLKARERAKLRLLALF